MDPDTGSGSLDAEVGSRMRVGWCAWPDKPPPPAAAADPLGKPKPDFCLLSTVDEPAVAVAVAVEAAVAVAVALALALALVTATAAAPAFTPARRGVRIPEAVAAPAAAFRAVVAATLCALATVSRSALPGLGLPEDLLLPLLLLLVVVVVVVVLAVLAARRAETGGRRAEAPAPVLLDTRVGVRMLLYTALPPPPPPPTEAEAEVEVEAEAATFRRGVRGAPGIPLPLDGGVPVAVAVPPEALPAAAPGALLLGVVAVLPLAAAVEAAAAAVEAAAAPAEAFLPGVVVP
jgi:hypothetical protein